MWKVTEMFFTGTCQLTTKSIADTVLEAKFDRVTLETRVYTIRVTIDGKDCAPSGGDNSNRVVLLSPTDTLQWIVELTIFTPMIIGGPGLMFIYWCSQYHYILNHIRSKLLA